MRTLHERMEAAQQLLAPFAVPITGTLGRVCREPEDETRFAFQRDRDRIVHTQAFRRLKGKTQVFVVGQGDHYRTRLTHTMEVALISRDIARTLSLNEDLAECIALAHDLGHPPFGHAGENALNEWMGQFGKRFEHNEQSHRIVTLLEEHSTQFPGLNLNQEILEGLLKHTTPHDIPHIPSGHALRAPSLEAQLVNIADEIAYTGHDCEDGLRAGLFSLKDLQAMPLAKEAHTQSQERGTSLRGTLIHILVMDLYGATDQNLQHIPSLNDVYGNTEPIVTFSTTIRDELETLRAFLWKYMYMHPSVHERNTEGKTVVLSLCDALRAKPNTKVLELQQRTQGTLEEAVKDYVAGMTDTYAVSQLDAIRT